MTVVKVTDTDEIVITAIRFIFKTTRRYVRVERNIWYNKDLHQEVTDEEMEHLPDEQLIWGKK